MNGNGIVLVGAVKRALLAFLSIFALLSVFGCSNKFWDPTQVGRFRPKPAVNVILDSLGVAEEEPSAWAGAEEPKPADVREFETDYTLGPGDVVSVSIFELLQENILFTNNYIITESGKLSIPEVGVVQAEALTETQLEEEISNMLEPAILKEPSVVVTLMRSQRRTFSILGNGVGTPGRYQIPRSGFYLADALATAGGIGEFNVSYIYVSRAVTGEELTERAPSERQPNSTEIEDSISVPEDEMMETIRPRAGYSVERHIISAAEIVRDRELNKAARPGGLQGFANEAEFVRANEQHKSRRRELSQAGYNETNEEERGQIEWIFKDGKWIPFRSTHPMPEEKKEDKLIEPLPEKEPSAFKWKEVGAGGEQTRVIKIPVDKFQSGDPRYNVVIRAGDTIYVPVDIIGEFYIAGNVNKQGAINLTGRPMTLKMAIAAAGGLGPLAWPKKCEVIRRLGKDREEIVMVDLDKIFNGEQPDFFIKENDLINVGTHPSSRWRAVLRNAFRASYGFGFLYDRNFAYQDFRYRDDVFSDLF